MTAEDNLSDKVKEVTSREAGIKKRLDELTTSFGSKSEFSSLCYFASFTCLVFCIIFFLLLAAEKLGEKFTLNEDQEEDPLLDSVSILEMNCRLARNGLAYARRSFNRLFKHFFPKSEAPEKFEALAKVFTAAEDPALSYHRAATKTGVEVSIALAMASGEEVDWDKVISFRGVTKDALTTFLKSAKKYSKKMVAVVDPSSATSTSTAHTEVQ